MRSQIASFCAGKKRVLFSIKKPPLNPLSWLEVLIYPCVQKAQGLAMAISLSLFQKHTHTHFQKHIKHTHTLLQKHTHTHTHFQKHIKHSPRPDVWRQTEQSQEVGIPARDFHSLTCYEPTYYSHTDTHSLIYIYTHRVKRTQAQTTREEDR